MIWLMGSFTFQPTFVAQIFALIFILLCPVSQYLQIQLWNHPALINFK